MSESEAEWGGWSQNISGKNNSSQRVHFSLELHDSEEFASLLISQYIFSPLTNKTSSTGDTSKIWGIFSFIAGFQIL